MRLKIITMTLMLLLFVSPAMQLVNAQDNETEPLDATNSTIPIPPPDLNTTLPGTNSTTLNVTSTDTDGEPVDLLILALIREQAQNRTMEMQTLFGEGTQSPEITNGLMHAQQAMEQAMLFEGINTRAAAQQYLRAMKQYRNTLRNYLKDNPDALDEFETEPVVNGTAKDDINGTVTAAQLSSAQTRLINAFEERFRDQLTAMIQNVNDVSDDMSPQDAFKAQQALTKAEQKLLRIQERILNGQYDEALDDLDNATTTLSDDFDDVDDPATAQMLRTMNQLEAKIQKMEQKAAKKSAKGQSTAEEDALLAELHGNKDHTKNDYKENKGKGNSGNSGKPDKNKDHTKNDYKENKGKGNSGNSGKPDKNKGKPDKDK